jgi:hypothetical protein
MRILHELPQGVLQMTPENQNNRDIIKWSGGPHVPGIGDKVNVTMNGLGEGTVRGYFTSTGWLGVAVSLDNPPDWYTWQNEGKNPLAFVFGAEVTSL